MSFLHVVTSVRCLSCGTVYPKPSALGTAESNPGCPRCSYVGWVPCEDDEHGDVTAGLEPLRFDADRPRLRFWQAS